MNKVPYRTLPAVLATTLVWATAGPAVAQPPSAPSANTATTAEPAPVGKDQGSYLMGLQFSEQLRQLGVTADVSPEAIAGGLKDGLAGKRMSDEDRTSFKQYVAATMSASVDRNAAAAKEFLARNASDKGVRTTASGLQYRIVTAGDPKAASAAPADQVTVHYRGRLLDGSEFDSSYARKVPATLRANGVIKGWQEALALMKPGAKWQLWIPPELGYDRVPRPGIPGGSLLIFDVELLSIQPAEKP